MDVLEPVPQPRERKASLPGLEEQSTGHRYNMRSRSRSQSMSGALQVPTMPMEHFAHKATLNGYGNGSNEYDPDVMDMD